ncbi:type II toxin-antitoxin system PemK/MazF family toxin [Candidatus Pacearchaeota archaeon]|nr:type II toxin-antitoxin system PemK/MazF family toxin [Candidatus Pacearchaeota archaeon]
MSGGMMYEQKEIVIIPFPYSDLTGSKQRPALIISNKLINKTEDRICCLITSKPHKDDLAIITRALETGELPLKSWVRPHRLFTIQARIIKKKLCTINDGFHDTVIKHINEYIKRK